jgi:DNA-binding SARP family transcriptional activator
VANALVVLPPIVARLLAFLALRRDPTPRQLAADVLWGEEAGARSTACLRSALWRAGRVDVPLITKQASDLSIASGVCIDMQQARFFATALARHGASPDPAAVVRLLTTDLLPHWDDDWLLLERERFRMVRLHALEIAAVRLAERSDYLDALDVGIFAVAADPLRESAHRAVIRVHLMEGNYADALSQFNVYDEIARKELGVEPSPQIRRLVSASALATRG